MKYVENVINRGQWTIFMTILEKSKSITISMFIFLYGTVNKEIVSMFYESPSQNL
jgi:hypothetical protein